MKLIALMIALVLALLPTMAEAKERLAQLAARGPSDYAFGWESVPAAQLWKTAQCAAPHGQVA